MRDVVVTGIGVVAGDVTDPQALFARLAAGESMVREHERYRCYGFRNAAAGFVTDGAWRVVEASLKSIEPAWGPPTRLGLYAGRYAWRSSGLAEPKYSPDRAGVFVGSNKFNFDEHHLADLGAYFDPVTEQLDLDAFLEAKSHDPNAYYHKHQDSTALALCGDLELSHSSSTHGDACAAGSMAIGSAFRHIRCGGIDVALAGASETMCNFTPLAAFTAIGASAAQAEFPAAEISRPFDRRRAGFVMGEGAAFLVLEAAECARARGAPVLARVRGFANCLEAYRITASPDDGSEYARCMTDALSDAGMSAQEIDHINAHGTSTPANDTSEARAIKLVFGPRAARIPITANKSALGHSLATSGAMEAVLSVLTLQQQRLLPTLNFSGADDATDALDVVMQSRQVPVRNVLSNSFGFGGTNCALIFEKI